MTGNDTTKPVRRLFLALWPDAATQRKLHHALPRQLRGLGRRIPADRLHVTLVFLGPVDAECQACVEQAVTDAIDAVPAFELRLDRLGHFPRPCVLWLGGEETPGPLLEIVNGLRQRLRGCGFAPESRPFKAHVTLLRKAARPGPLPEIEPVLWPVDALSLIESDTRPEGAVYTVVRRWPLSAQVCDNPA